MPTRVNPTSIATYDAALTKFRNSTGDGLAELLARTLLVMRPNAHTLLMPTQDADPDPAHVPGDTDRPLVLDPDDHVVLRIAERHLPRVTDSELLNLWDPLLPDCPLSLLTVVDALRRGGAILPRLPRARRGERLPLSDDALREAGGRRLSWADPYARHANEHDLDAETARFQVTADAHARLLGDTLRAFYASAHYLVFTLEHRLGEDEEYIDLVHMLDADGDIVQEFDMPDPALGPLPEYLRLAWGHVPNYLDFVEAIRRLHRAGARFDELPEGAHRLPRAPGYGGRMYCLRLTPHASAQHFHEPRRLGWGPATRHRRLQPVPPGRLG
ncbi:hypothetical protein [Embleya sp. NBC_00896]|uniref:hypothetical protein n=1 Tax=Embleya sp. NBC_00896 TaxID=2975961 RepID=UPI002F912A29|nr:hypothetical protein OG928_48460 [Embleya sp. NBC_00896]